MAYFLYILFSFFKFSRKFLKISIEFFQKLPYFYKIIFQKSFQFF